MIRTLIGIRVSLGLIGIGLGILMGIRHDFMLVQAHAHLNLLGFVTMFLSALYYRAVPQAAGSKLARLQAIVSVVGAAAFPAGIACAYERAARYSIPSRSTGAVLRACWAAKTVARSSSRPRNGAGWKRR